MGWSYMERTSPWKAMRKYQEEADNIIKEGLGTKHELFENVASVMTMTSQE